MRVTTAALAACTLLFSSPLAFAASTGTFAEAKTKAAQRNVPVLLDFYTQT